MICPKCGTRMVYGKQWCCLACWHSMQGEPPLKWGRTVVTCRYCGRQEERHALKQCCEQCSPSGWDTLYLEQVVDELLAENSRLRERFGEVEV